MRRVVLLSLVLAACTAPAPEAQSTPEPARFNSIAFEINSWGRPIDKWQVGADGLGTHVTMVDNDTSTFRSYQLEHREFKVAPADFATLEAMAAKLQLPRLSRDDCDERATDMPYGTLTLVRGGRAESIPFDIGCLDKPYQRFVSTLRGMDDTVTAWAKAKMPTRTEQIEQ